MYQYIVEVEMMFLMQYKLDLWSVESRLTIMDLEFYVKTLMFKLEEEHKKNNQGGNKLMNCLRAIRDILNVMFMKESPR